MVATLAQQGTQARSTLLVVEDDADTRSLLADLFREQGFLVVTAAHGGEAIETLQRMEPPTAVFVDLLMPGIIGHSVLEFLHSSPALANVPVAVVTGSPELAPAGVSVFPKPIRFAELLAFVQTSSARRKTYV